MPKRARATASLRSSSSGSGSASQARSGPGSAASNHSNPNAASSRATGNPPTAIGLRCSADSINGSPKPSQDEGSTTASQAAYAPAIRTSNGNRRRTGTCPASSTAASSSWYPSSAGPVSQ
jgi:hypothetical protein